MREDQARSERLREHFAWMGLLLLALAYRVYALTGDMFYDPIVYAQNAYNMLHGGFTLASHSWYAHRLPVFAPLVPLYALFEPGMWSSRVWPLVASMAPLVLLAWVGARKAVEPAAAPPEGLWNRRTTLFALLLVAIAPLDVSNSSILQPDVIMGAFVAFAALLWIMALEREGPAPRTLLFLSGFFFALAVMTRENAAPFILFYLISALWKRLPLTRLLWTAAGGLIVVLPTLAAYTIVTGDPFYRWTVVSSSYGAPVMNEGARLDYYPSLLRHVRRTPTGLFAPLYALGIVWGVVRPRRERLWLLLWVLPLLLYLQFGSMSLTRYIPILKRDRFLVPLGIPLALLAASMLVEWWEWLRIRLAGRARASGGSFLRRERWAWLPVALLVLILVVNSFSIVRPRRDASARTARAFHAACAVLRSQPELPVLFDHWRTAFRFAYYLGFREGADLYRGGVDEERMARRDGGGRLGYLAWYPDSTQVPDALIVLDRLALDEVGRGDGSDGPYVAGQVPAYAHHPPGSWRLLAEHGTFRIYRSR